MNVRVCAACGHPLSTVARFCPNCGSDSGDSVLVARPEEQRVPWRAAEGIAIYLISFVVAAIAAGVGAVFVRDADRLTAAAILAQQIALLLTTLTWTRLVHKSSVERLGLTRPKGEDVGVGVGFGALGILLQFVVTAIVVFIAEQLFGPVELPKQIPLESDEPTTGVLVMIGVSVVLLAPIGEELFFRGFLYRAMRRWARVGPAIVLSAAVFAVAHVQPLVIPTIFVFGAVLAYLVERRGTVVPSMVAHMVFNAFGFTVLFIL